MVFGVGNATHNRVFGSAIENLSGGATAPPQDLVGVSLSGGIGVRKIVHAKDFGNALASGQIRPVIDSVFDLADIQKAHKRMAANENIGKIVLEM